MHERQLTETEDAPRHTALSDSVRDIIVTNTPQPHLFASHTARSDSRVPTPDSQLPPMLLYLHFSNSLLNTLPPHHERPSSHNTHPNDQPPCTTPISLSHRARRYTATTPPTTSISATTAGSPIINSSKPAPHHRISTDTSHSSILCAFPTCHPPLLCRSVDTQHPAIHQFHHRTFSQAEHSTFAVQRSSCLLTYFPHSRT